MSMKQIPWFLVLAVLAGLALTATGCQSDAPSDPSATPTANQPDKRPSTGTP